MNMKSRLFFNVFRAVVILLILFLSACSRQKNSSAGVESSESVDFTTLEFTQNTDIRFASRFSIESSGDYKLIKILNIYGNEDVFLLLPEGAGKPSNLPENIQVLKRPLNKTYLVSTSQMDFICKTGALDMVKLSGTREKDWFVEEAKKAMQEKKLLYAGKYSSPDYELLMAEGCNLAIENTMVYHKSEIKEKLEELGIPVLVEHSGYEADPLGRLEWIKLYGVLFGKETQAANFFNEQVKKIVSLDTNCESGNTIAFFFINSSGSANVRKGNDYISKMINMSGGKYFISFNSAETGSGLSTINMQMEDFYKEAVNSDILIYNSTIDGKLSGIEQLLQKSALFSDFKAVKEGKVYCTEKNFFQEVTGMADFMTDINNIVRGNDSCLNTVTKLK